MTHNMTPMTTMQRLMAASMETTLTMDLAGFQGPARVLDVYDGDTITVAIEYPPGYTFRHSLRVAGIDAPEMTGGQAMTVSQAVSAREALLALLLPEAIGQCPAQSNAQSNTQSKASRRKETRALLAEHPVIVTASVRGAEKYGRLLASVRLGSGADLAAKMLAGGYAVRYDGGSKK